MLRPTLTTALLLALASGCSAPPAPSVPPARFASLSEEAAYLTSLDQPTVSQWRRLQDLKWGAVGAGPAENPKLGHELTATDHPERH